MYAMIEDSLARMLDDAGGKLGSGTDATQAADAPRALLAQLHEAGMLDLLVSEDGEPPMAWADAARLFMLLGAKAPEAPVADAILARSLVAGRIQGLPAFTVLAGNLDGDALTLDRSASAARVSGTVQGVPWGAAADVVVAPLSDGIVVLPRPATVSIRGFGVEPRAAWTFAAAEPLAVLDCPAGIATALLASATRAAQIAGAMRAARELTIGYANDRVQFGKPIGRQQAVQHRIAVMAEHSALVAAAAMLAWAGDGPPDSPDRVATAKGLASEYAGEVAAAAHAVHGAIGFTEEYALQRLTRRMWQWRSEHGGAAACFEAIGARVLAGPQESVWDRVVRSTDLSSPS
ncbi:acyl-CoA dehydrogenase family protein [Zeimonas arvi]|uniref:Acyl-CoA dehydrogenase n=1 Tax=Zeimonas arvi TaxID=2498847 RepID=A0A5C8P4N7_9BURK|nr:acyl-CoA dehydrogenase family protein [Zeimonas arvi]TXL68195.1 acyl-CoA dehydrogenase [Zeimonas arvi]